MGDKVYGNYKNEDRMYLHATSLEITIPPQKEGDNSQRKVFEAALPSAFEEKLENE